MDAAGVVDKLGEGTDGRLAVGDAVIAYVIPFGSHGGGYAEKIVVAESSVVPAPCGAAFPEAATLLLNATTARLALDALALPPGATVAVVGGAHGRHHRRSPVGSCGDGLPPGRRGPAHREGRGGSGRFMTHLPRSAATLTTAWPGAEVGPQDQHGLAGFDGDGATFSAARPRWYDRIGYKVVRTGPVGEYHPNLSPLLATACNFVIYRQDLSDPAHDGRRPRAR